MKNKIVITKTGAISPIGVGVENFISNIQKINNPQDIKTFDTEKYDIKKAFVANDFDPKPILGDKGLRNFNRNTLFILSAIKKDMDNEINYFKTEDKRLGLTIGTCFGSLQSISDYELDIFDKGPRKINPMGFGNTVLNSPTSRANIWFGLTSQSTTVSTGSISSAKAIEFSIGQINKNVVDAMICGGAEELNMQTFLGYYLNKFLTKNEEITCYEKNSTGTIISEGCGLALLETYENAVKRGAKILASILGYGTSFYGSIDNTKNFSTKGVVNSIKNALKNGNIDTKDIDLVISSANGLTPFDSMEENSLMEVFGDRLTEIPVIPLKSLIGETIGASGLFSIVAASNIKDIKELPFVYKYSNGQKKLIKVNNFKINYSNFTKILVNCISECGNHSAIILQIEK
ncbi:MAG: hypothetical protein A2086_05500 [Spirochaetes bacterium GWD1_27_9]|nr:MAG: hypothetical protein A2Z98_16675 [Spirochaetes bacterium GWB1_27_13]OHD24170.1 MAG: hypothetical protein A2Y34_18505 [Spirochaetes bacterium GWC1_27_15]OHD37826.1 MAG: hypothetical protein A2086_05500 [Spirochaetes bacterium GWD1_27_9]